MTAKAVFLLALVFSAVAFSTAQARVFDFKKESIAPYFRGTGGLSSVKNEGFANAKGDDSVIGDDGSNLNYSGEIGVLFHLAEKFSFRLGVEALQSGAVSNLKAETSSGNELYTLESTTFVWHPNAAVEFIHRQDNIFRFFTYFGMGYGSLTLENDYAMTTLGSTTYVPSYKEKLEATSTSYFGGVGLEVLMTDATTFELDAGYRLMKFNQLKHKGPIETIQGEFEKGAVGINDDGSGRRLDFSGFYMGLSFRFYIEVI